MQRVEDLWERRARYARRYTEAFRALPEVDTPPDAPPLDQHSWHLYVLRLNAERLTIDRAAFIEELRARGIGASVHFIPLHLHPYYRQTYGYRAADCPVASAAYEQILSLPLYARMTPEDVERVIDAVMDIVQRYRG